MNDYERTLEDLRSDIAFEVGSDADVDRLIELVEKRTRQQVADQLDSRFPDGPGNAYADGWLEASRYVRNNSLEG